jgi:hypothetical protein
MNRSLLLTSAFKLNVDITHALRIRTVVCHFNMEPNLVPLGPHNGVCG